MDSTPPQAPPAIVSSTRPEAADGLARLASVQSWLSARQQELPLLPAQPIPAGRDAWLAALDAFWQRPVEDAPGAPPVPRVDALATRLASAMRDEAIVRRIDGTLDVAAANLAERFARSLGGDLPPGMEARSLRVGSVEYAGAVIVLDRNETSLVMRFMPDRGWDVFDSLDRLHAQTEVRLREALVRRRDLPGVRADDTEGVIASDRFVDSLPLGVGVFHRLARRIVALQREKVEDAWPSDRDASSTPSFPDDATAAIDLHDTLDIFALLVAREGRLAIALNEQRLARVPTDVALGWRGAVEEYRLARLLAASSARQHAGDAPLNLASWSRRELVAAFLRRGIALDPDDIQLEASGSETFTPPTIGTAAGEVPVRMSLTEFSLRNTGHYDGRQLRVVADALPSNSPVPGVRTLREVARELDLAPRFDAYLRQRASDPHGRRFRQTTMRLQQARMRVEAAAARMANHLGDEPAAFIDDREERGYRMVEAILDSPTAARRRVVGDHRITVRQLVYRGAAVSDVLIIGVRDPHSSSRVVLYTPDAPDGRSFREFDDRAMASRQFLYAPAFQEYLLRRLPAEYGEALPSGKSRRFRVSEATRRARWVLAAPSDGRGTVTEEPFEERVVEGDVRTALFDAEIVRQARDVAWLGRSTAQADIDAIAGLFSGVLRGLRGPTALLEDTVGAVGQALRATWRFYDSVKAGDSEQAFVDFTDAYTASLKLAGWYAGASVTTRPGVSMRPLGVRLADARQRLDSRYAVHGVDLTGIPPDVIGVHRLHGRRYIRQHGLVFELDHQPASDTWRLTRPNALDAAFPGPALQPTPSGGWRLRPDIGLRGGWADDAALAQPRARGVSGQELEGLTDFQRWTFQQSLMARLRNGGEASLIYWEATARAYPRWVTLRQRTAWNDALRTARATPATPLPVGAEPGAGASWRVLPAREWPGQVWHYPAGIGTVVAGEGPLVLPLRAVPGSGLTGLPVSLLAPADAAGSRWIRVHLDRYRNRTGTTASPGLRIIEDRRGPTPTYVLQPETDGPVDFLGLEPGDFTAGGRLTR